MVESIKKTEDVMDVYLLKEKDTAYTTLAICVTKNEGFTYVFEYARDGDSENRSRELGTK